MSKATLTNCIIPLLLLVSLEATALQTGPKSIEKLIATSETLKVTQPDSAIYYLKEAIQLVPKDDRKQKAFLHNKQATVYHLHAKLEEMHQQLLLVKQIVDEDSSLFFPEYFLNHGSYFLRKQQSDSALWYLLKGYDMSSSSEDKVLPFRFLNNISVVHLQQGQKEKALPYLKQAVSTYEQDDFFKLQFSTNLASVYKDLNKIESALMLYRTIEPLAIQLKAVRVLSPMYSNLCDIYREQKQYEKSILYGEKSLSIKQEHQLPYINYTLNNLGLTYRLKGDFRTSEKYLLQALEGSVSNERLSILNNLKDTYKDWGQTTNALDYAEEYNALKDSLDQLEYDTRIAEISEKYQNDKKEQAVQLLEAKVALQDVQIRQQYHTIGGIVFGVLILSAFAFIFYQQQKTQQLLDHSKLKHQFMRMQLNPHFLFNALQSIQYYLFKNDQEKSISYLGNFSMLMRDILESSDKEWIILSKEKVMMENYLQLQQAMADHPISYSINVDDDIQSDEIMIPSMIIQPYVENAVVHGIKKRENGKIDVSIGQTGKSIVVTVQDNGVGMSGSNDEQQKLHRSMSSSINKDRLDYLQKSMKVRTEISIQHAGTDRQFPGTLVTISIPFKIAT